MQRFKKLLFYYFTLATKTFRKTLTHGVELGPLTGMRVKRFIGRFSIFQCQLLWLIFLPYLETEIKLLNTLKKKINETVELKE